MSEYTRSSQLFFARAVRLIALLVLALLHISWLDPVKDDVDEANRQYYLGNYDESMKKYSQALGERPDSPELHYNLGDVQFKKGHLAEAAKEFQASVTTSQQVPLAAKALYNLGNSYLSQGQPTEAVEMYKKSLRLNPGDLDAKYNLEMALLQMQQNPQQQKQQQDQQNKQDNPTPTQSETSTPSDSQQQGSPTPQPEQEQQENSTPTRSEGGQMNTPTPTAGQPLGSGEESTPGASPTPLEREQFERLLDRLDQKELEIIKQLRGTPSPIHVEKDW